MASRCTVRDHIKGTFQVGFNYVRVVDRYFPIFDFDIETGAIDRRCFPCRQLGKFGAATFDVSGVGEALGKGCLGKLGAATFDVSGVGEALGDGRTCG